MKHDRFRALALLAAALLTALTATAFALLIADSPPWGGAWRDGHFALGMLIGAGAAAVAVALLARRRLGALALAWIVMLAIAGLILMLACWLGLVVAVVD